MGSTFGGLEIGSRALSANQLALDVTSHNLANANTPGYSRQTATFNSTTPFTDPSFAQLQGAGQVGTGVEITSILRVKDQLLDQQIQRETSSQGNWQAKQDAFSQIEQIVNETSDSGLNSTIDKFWNSLQNLSTNPQDQSVRATVTQQAITLTDQIKQNYSSLESIRSDINSNIGVQVSKVNTYANQIAALNDKIGKLNALGEQPNDLLDQRDQLVGELSQITKISQFSDAQGRLSVTIGGVALVAGDKANQIVAEPDTSNQSFYELHWAQDNNPNTNQVQISDGSLKGLQDMRDQYIPALETKLNGFAGTLITQVNTIHQKGYGLDGSTGTNFFQGTNAQDIDVTDVIKEDPTKIAASSDGAAGNGDVALQLADLKTQPVLNQNTTTMGDYLSSLVAQIGVDSSEASNMSNNQTQLIGSLNNRKESISGVSTDEEMTNMIKYQQGYTAAAKIISTMNAMLDVVVNQIKVNP